jgi:phage tail-like protein
MASREQLLAQATPAFRFVVSIDNEAIAAFTECTLPNVEWEIEEVKEGGLNTYIHQLPGRRKSARVTLKNGVGKTSLVDWCIQTMAEQFKRKRVSVSLFDSTRAAKATWTIEDALPVKWAGPQLRSSDNTVAIQTLELAGGEITVEING